MSTEAEPSDTGLSATFPPPRSRLWCWIRRVLLISGALVLITGLCIGAVWLYFHPHFEQTRGVVYGHRAGRDLVLDVIRPARPNGLGIVLVVSGSWKSGTNSYRPWMVAPVLRHGYTVFAVTHISQPEVTIMDIAEDMHRAVRFIRSRASEYGIDPDRLGVTGGSAGGHLSLLLATRGGRGPADAPDPVDRLSSAVQAVAIFYPVTDLLNLGKSTENPGNGGPPKSFVRGFGPQATNLPDWKVIGHGLSPVYYVNSNLPPTLIYHGDADTLVPLEQSEWFRDRAKAVGRDVKVVVHPGGHHGWLTMVFDIRHFASWFDEHLLPKK